MDLRWHHRDIPEKSTVQVEREDGQGRLVGVPAWGLRPHPYPEVQGHMGVSGDVGMLPHWTLDPAVAP